MLEKLQAFTQGKYESSGSGEDIVQRYQSLEGTTVEQMDSLGITKRIVSTGKWDRHAVICILRAHLAKLMQTRKATSGSSANLNAPSVVRTPSSTSSIGKKAPPPPPTLKSSGSNYDPSPAPPPYSAGTSGAATSIASKRAPPPVPASKPKPKPSEPPKKYVVALYDFAAQADGDLDFKSGDRIELVERTENVEDWWTGKLNGKEGVFPGMFRRFIGFLLLSIEPGNYVQEA